MAIPREAWGSTGGWITAAALALAVVAGVAYVGNARAMTPPTALGRSPARWSQLRHPTVPHLVLDRAPAAQDASEIYANVVDTFYARPAARRPYDDLVGDDVLEPARRGALPLVDELLRARDAGEARFFADRPDALIGGDGMNDALEALLVVGRATARQGTLLATRARQTESAEDLREATRHFEAAYTLGYHLFDERITHRQLEVGYRLMGEGLSGLVSLQRIREDQVRRAILSTQKESLAAYVRNTIAPVWSAIGTINDRSRSDDAADVHFGDVAAIAASDEADALWRVEAILRLGEYAADADRPADAAGARRLLERLAAEVADDPRLLAAIEAARATARGS